MLLWPSTNDTYTHTVNVWSHSAVYQQEFDCVPQNESEPVAFFPHTNPVTYLWQVLQQPSSLLLTLHVCACMRVYANACMCACVHAGACYSCLLSFLNLHCNICGVIKISFTYENRLQCLRVNWPTFSTENTNTNIAVYITVHLLYTHIIIIVYCYKHISWDF